MGVSSTCRPSCVGKIRIFDGMVKQGDLQRDDPDGRGMPVGVKFVELILKPAREGLEKKNEHPTLPGAGECWRTSLLEKAYTFSTMKVKSH